MAESTLTLDFNGLKSAVGYELRFGRDASLWTADQSFSVDSVIQTGVRWACFPTEVRLPDGTLISAFRWSWLTPVGSLRAFATVSAASGATVVSNGDAYNCVLTFGGTSAIYNPEMVGKTISFYTNNDSQTLVASKTIAKISGSTATLAIGETVAAGTYRWGMVSDGTYRLWDDFGGFEGAALSLSTGNWRPQVRFTNEASLRDLARRSAEGSTGWPVYGAVRVLASNGPTAPQRYELLVHPVPSELVTLYGQYVRVIDALSEVLRYPPGGAPFSELFLSACLAAAENRVNDARGLRWEEYVRTVSLCAMHDVQATAPRIAGQTIRHDYCEDDLPLHCFGGPPTVYNGIPHPG